MFPIVKKLTGSIMICYRNFNGSIDFEDFCLLLFFFPFVGLSMIELKDGGL